MFALFLSDSSNKKSQPEKHRCAHCQRKSAHLQLQAPRPGCWRQQCSASTFPCVLRAPLQLRWQPQCSALWWCVCIALWMCILTLSLFFLKTDWLVFLLPSKTVCTCVYVTAFCSACLTLVKAGETQWLVQLQVVPRNWSYVIDDDWHQPCLNPSGLQSPLLRLTVALRTSAVLNTVSAFSVICFFVRTAS